MRSHDWQFFFKNVNASIFLEFRFELRTIGKLEEIISSHQNILLDKIKNVWFETVLNNSKIMDSFININKSRECVFTIRDLFFTTFSLFFDWNAI